VLHVKLKNEEESTRLRSRYIIITSKNKFSGSFEVTLIA